MRPFDPVAAPACGAAGKEKVTTLDAMVQVEAGSLLRVPMSMETYAALGEAKFHEYYDGCLVVNPPTMRHAFAASNMVRLLWPSCGERLVVTGSGWTIDGEVFVPDLMVIDATSLAEPLLIAPPYLLVEILSPSTKRDDRGKKLEAYGAGGAAWYWIVDLDAPEVAVFRNTEGVFVEVQVARTATTLWPMGVRIDPRRLAEP